MLDAGLEVRAFFTSRLGGVSSAPYESLNLADYVGDHPRSVADNRDIVVTKAGGPVSLMTAEHGIKVHHVRHAGEQPPPADVLVTATPGVALVALAADCVPVLMHDHASGAVAAVHAGREGLYSGVLDAAVAALLDLRQKRTLAGSMSASIGPAICGQCYEVPGQMRDRVAGRHPIATSNTATGSPALDLPRATEVRLGQLGFEQIVRHNYCTYEDLRYFSHRRDDVTGRFGAVIVCE